MAEGGAEEFFEPPEDSVSLTDVDVSDIEVQLDKTKNELQKVVHEDGSRTVPSKTGEISVDACVCSNLDIRSWCEDCQGHLCLTCSLSHQKFPATKQHKLQLVGDALPELARSLIREFNVSAKEQIARLKEARERVEKVDADTEQRGTEANKWLRDERTKFIRIVNKHFTDLEGKFILIKFILTFNSNIT